jgi:hypothetical protein
VTRTNGICLTHYSAPAYKLLHFYKMWPPVRSVRIDKGHSSLRGEIRKEDARKMSKSASCFSLKSAS